MKILLVQSSPRASASVSNELSTALVERLRAKHPGSEVIVRNLAQEPAPYLLEPSQFAPFYTAPETHSETERETIRYSTEAVAELMAADVVVVATGMYSFTVASVLKSWFDHVSRARLTFRYTERGPEGLVKGKKVYLALSSGGVYSEGPSSPMDFQLPYLKAALGFLGMTDVSVARIEGTSLPTFDRPAAVAKALSSVGL